MKKKCESFEKIAVEILEKIQIKTVTIFCEILGSFEFMNEHSDHVCKVS